MPTRRNTRFFTNESGNNLYDRFKETMDNARFFDVLVGYFRTSGFYRLYKELEKTEKIRILVGINTDHTVYGLNELVAGQHSFDFLAHKECIKIFSDRLKNEMDTSDDSEEVEIAVNKFVEFLDSGKMELRAYLGRNLHAKVYITRFRDGDRDYGRVITGSSNFSENGLVAAREFNVELKDDADVEYALEQFEELWKDGVDVGKEYARTIREETWLSEEITPYELYLKFLYEYFKEDINIDDTMAMDLPKGFMNLSYQKQAVVAARKILNNYNGVFISDVVGLGKTFITAMLLKAIGGKSLIICPPALIDYWEETLEQFSVHFCKVESHGQLGNIINKGVEKFSNIVIDEAHNFRNEYTLGYEKLYEVCRNKKVILVTATPLNNKLDDLKSQIKLFQAENNCMIPGVKNLAAFFKIQEDERKKVSKGSEEYMAVVKKTSEQVRHKVLKHVMLRRTRSEVKKYFSEDMDKQGLSFPEVASPKQIVYEFSDEIGKAFNETIELLKRFSYARYTPVLYLLDDVGELEKQSQRNVGRFMKMLLVKRLESSFFAFKSSIRRFVDSHQNFIKMYDKGFVVTGVRVNVFDLLNDDDGEERLQKLENEGKAKKYAASKFTPEYRKALQKDCDVLKAIHGLWEHICADPKVDKLVENLKKNKTLRDKKVLIFSESKETVDYIYHELESSLPGKVLSYSSAGGMYGGVQFNKGYLREMVDSNFRPEHNNQRDNVNILVSTDVLSEGVNLHRSNIIINYDLPWNPVRVLQRVGRVNRVGTEYGKIHIFNIFPTEQGDEHLKLADNIKAKIQAFHSTLGEDAKYLSDSEEVIAHELFGDELYKRINDKSTYMDDDNEESELGYLQTIRNLRDKEPDLFEKIKKLPKKARVSRLAPKDMKDTSLITFFRKGMLKKFVINANANQKELTFMEAVEIFKCSISTKGIKTPKNYFEMMSQNKEYMFSITDADNQIDGLRRGTLANETKIIKNIKACLNQFTGYTDDEESYLREVIGVIDKGLIAKNKCKRIKQRIDGIKFDRLAILNIVRSEITEQELQMKESGGLKVAGNEVILSEFLKGKTK